MGSFINVVVHRLPSGGLRSLSGRSHCPQCKSTIAWFDNIPILSWLALRARCRVCRLPISKRYPCIEAICGILYWVAWWAQGRNDGIFAFTPMLIVHWGILSSLLALSLIDLDLRILPDELTISGMVLGPVVAMLVPGLLTKTWSYQKLAPWIENETLRVFVVSLLGLAAGAATIATIRTLGTLWFSSHVDWPAAESDAGTRVDAFLAHQKPRRSKNEVREWLEFGLVDLLRRGERRRLLTNDATLKLEKGDVLRVAIVKEAMGFGDVKLQGAIGAVLGPEGTFLVLAIASFAGAILGSFNLLRIFFLLKARAARRGRPKTAPLWQVARAAGGTIPFGPFLAIGAAVILLARAPIVNFLFEFWKTN